MDAVSSQLCSYPFPVVFRLGSCRPLADAVMVACYRIKGQGRGNHAGVAVSAVGVSGNNCRHGAAIDLGWILVRWPASFTSTFGTDTGTHWQINGPGREQRRDLRQ